MSKSYELLNSPIHNSYDEIKKKDWKSLENYKDKTPLSILFDCHDSIYTAIFKEYLVIVFIKILVSAFIMLYQPEELYVFKFLKNLADYFDSFPAEIIVFPLSFVLSQILSTKGEIFKEYIVFLDDFSFFCRRTIKNISRRKEVLSGVNKVIVLAFKKMEGDIDLFNVTFMGDRLFTDEEIQEWKSMGYDAWDHNLMNEIITHLEKTETKEDFEEYKSDLQHRLSEIAEKCRKLKQFNYIKVSYVYFSSVIFCCMLYLLTLILDFIPFTNTETDAISFLEFTVKFIILYGWPKFGIYSSYPFGCIYGRINLNAIASRNLRASSEIGFNIAKEISKKFMLVY